MVNKDYQKGGRFGGTQCIGHGVRKKDELH